MLNGEDPVHAAIPPRRTAGRTAARTAVTAADLHRPVPRGKAPEVLVAARALLAAPPAYPRLRLAANQQITFHHPDISFRGPQALGQ
jgi:hypothetical protein